MASRFNSPDVVGETTVLRVVRIGIVKRWLVLDTTLDDNTREMGQLVANAQEFVGKNTQFAGVEIRSVRVRLTT